jgi:DUF4097 and DUF4098 domain-containing protein YvlB
MKKTTILASGAALVLLLCAALATAQDFQKTYPVNPGTRIEIKNVSGDISVAGYDGRDVLVAAFKEGPDRELLQIEDLSTGDVISVRPVYPQNTRCNASVRFELRVPQGTELNFDSLSNASGDISLEGVKGNVRVNTASGDITVKRAEGNIEATTASGDVEVTGAAGVVNARTASGDVEVDLVEQGRAEEMKFSSASGDVTVRAPANLDADVRLSTASGKLSSDFPLHEEEPGRGPGRKASARLGSASCRLTLSTASGNVKLVRP